MIKFRFLGLITIIIFSSCSYHIGTIGGGTASVTNNQFASIDFAYGTAKTVNFLGIGGNKKDALVLEAKRNLYANYNLSSTQVIGQTTVDFKRTFICPLVITKVTVSAEIVDFSDQSINVNRNEENKARFINTQKGSTQIPISASEPDKLFTPQNPKGELVKFRYKEEVLTGEILEISKTSYLIKMEKGNGEVVGIYISESDIIK